MERCGQATVLGQACTDQCDLVEAEHHGHPGLGAPHFHPEGYLLLPTDFSKKKAKALSACFWVEKATPPSATREASHSRGSIAARPSPVQPAQARLLLPVEVTGGGEVGAPARNPCPETVLSSTKTIGLNKANEFLQRARNPIEHSSPSRMLRKKHQTIKPTGMQTETKLFPRLPPPILPGVTASRSPYCVASGRGARGALHKIPLAPLISELHNESVLSKIWAHTHPYEVGSKCMTKRSRTFEA